MNIKNVKLNNKFYFEQIIKNFKDDEVYTAKELHEMVSMANPDICGSTNIINVNLRRLDCERVIFGHVSYYGNKKAIKRLKKRLGVK